MTSYFTLTLDTTPPKIEVYTPNYVTSGQVLDINVTADEYLSSRQLIYLEDSAGKRLEVTLFNNGESLTGRVRVLGLRDGIINLYVQVFDEVMNGSDLISKATALRTTNKIELYPELKQRKPTNEVRVRKLRTEMGQRRHGAKITKRPNATSVKTRKHKLNIDKCPE